MNIFIVLLAFFELPEEDLAYAEPEHACVRGSSDVEAKSHKRQRSSEALACVQHDVRAQSHVNTNMLDSRINDSEYVAVIDDSDDDSFCTCESDSPD